MQNRYNSGYNLEEKPIAEGSYGEIFIAKDPNGETCVVKVIDDLFYSKLAAHRILREIKLLKALNNYPYVIKLKDIIFPEETEKSFESLSLVFEKMDTDLSKIIYSNQTLTDEHIQFFVVQLLCALSCLHSAGIAHRDLKPANVLVNEDCKLAICDFGFSREIDEKFEIGITGNLQNESQSASKTTTSSTLFRHLTPYITTRWYRAPEALMIGDYGSQVDMWGFGCILAELLMMQTTQDQRCPLFMGTSSYPFSLEGGNPCRSTKDQLNIIFDVLGTPTVDDIKSICRNQKILDELINLPKKLPQDLDTLFSYVKNKQAIDLLKRCLVINPAERLTADKALEHPFLQSMVEKFKKTNRTLTLPFPLSPYSIADKQALMEYHEFEKMLEARRVYEHQTKKTKTHKTSESKVQTDEIPNKIRRKDLRRLIWAEMETYHVSKSPSSSLSSLSSLSSENEFLDQIEEDMREGNHTQIPLEKSSVENNTCSLMSDEAQPNPNGEISVSVKYARLSSTVSAAGMYKDKPCPPPATTVISDKNILRAVCGFCTLL